MKSKLLLTACGGLLIINCSTQARIIRQTDRTAIIQANAISKTEAMLFAEEKAKELFGNYRQTAEPECRQGMAGMADSGTATLTTFMSCTIQVEKQ